MTRLEIDQIINHQVDLYNARTRKNVIDKSDKTIKNLTAIITKTINHKNCRPEAKERLIRVMEHLKLFNPIFQLTKLFKP